MTEKMNDLEELAAKLLRQKEDEREECLANGYIYVDYSEGVCSLLDYLTGRSIDNIFVGRGDFLITTSRSSNW